MIITRTHNEAVIRTKAIFYIFFFPREEEENLLLLLLLLCCACIMHHSHYSLHQTLDKMRMEAVSPTVQLYVSIMDTLSLHGYGSHVTSILPLVIAEPHLPRGQL